MNLPRCLAHLYTNSIKHLPSPLLATLPSKHFPLGAQIQWILQMPHLPLVSLSQILRSQQKLTQVLQSQQGREEKFHWSLVSDRGKEENRKMQGKLLRDFWFLCLH